MSQFFKKNFKGIGKSIVFNPFGKKEALENVVKQAETSSELKETYLKRFKNYILLVLNDYKTVGKGALIHMKDHPIKSITYGTLLGSFIICYKKNPDYDNYIDTRRDYANEMIMCGTTYNKKTEYYLNSLNKLEYCNLLEYKSCLVFSLILARNFSSNESTYEKQCAPLQNPGKYNVFNYLNSSLRFMSRVVDIGFFDNLYFLNKNYREFDVNDDEWTGKTSSTN